MRAASLQWAPRGRTLLLAASCSLRGHRARSTSLWHGHQCPECLLQVGQIGFVPTWFCSFQKTRYNKKSECDSHQRWGSFRSASSASKPDQQRHCTFSPLPFHPICPRKYLIYCDHCEKQYFCSVNGSKYLKSHGAFFALISNLLNKYCCVNQQSVSCN